MIPQKVWSSLSVEAETRKELEKSDSYSDGRLSTEQSETYQSYPP